jgi:hypothetical protein
VPKKKTAPPESEPFYNAEAEGAVVAGILAWPEIISEVREKLSPDDFYTELKYAYEAMGADEPTLSNVCESLRKSGHLQEVGGVSVLGRLVEAAVTRTSALGWVDEIKRLSNMRKLVNLGIEIQGLPSTENSFDLALVKARQMLDDLASETRTIIPTFSRLRIQESHPRKYIMAVLPGGDLQVKSFAQLIAPRAMASLIVEQFDYLPIMPKKEEWESFIRRQLLVAEKEAAPMEATIEGEVKETIQELLELRGEARSILDVKTGAYVVREVEGMKYYLFMPTAILKWLKDHKKPISNNADLWAWIKQWGGKKDVSVRVAKEAPRKLWAVPASVFEDNQEEEIPDWME